MILVARNLHNRTKCKRGGNACVAVLYRVPFSETHTRLSWLPHLDVVFIAQPIPGGALTEEHPDRGSDMPDSLSIPWLYVRDVQISNR
jgi:hypothetical protein